MTLKLKTNSKNGRAAIYEGAIYPVRFQLSVFPNKTAPATIEVPDGVFREPRKLMTEEERKAARKAKPKPTLAEKIERRKAALERLIAKQQAQAAGGNAAAASM